MNASRNLHDRNPVKITSIDLELSDTSDLKKILHDENEVAIKDNIKSKNIYLNPVLRMINIDGCKADDRKKRREINKCFMNSLSKCFLFFKNFGYVLKNYPKRIRDKS